MRLDLAPDFASDLVRALAEGGGRLARTAVAALAASRGPGPPIRRAVAARHLPQIHVRYPGSSDERWTAHGAFERAPLWPMPGDPAAFGRPEWTAYYRPHPGASQLAFAEGEAPFWQVFVCRGALQLVSGGRLLRLSSGDFLSGVFPEADLARARASEDAVLLVKREPAARERLGARVDRRARRVFFPYLHARGELDDFSGASLRGGIFSPRSTRIVRFPVGSVTSSHYHDAPLFHEIVYLWGGHRTPDGYYAQGDHVTSLPGCKEGPWLAAHDIGPLREGWPRYESAESAPAPRPWEHPCPGGSNDVVGILFVHRGAFLDRALRVRWHELGAEELGPKG